MITQLRDVSMHVLGARRRALWKLRREEQEDSIYRVKEVTKVNNLIYYFFIYLLSFFILHDLFYIFMYHFISDSIFLFIFLFYFILIFL